MNRDFEEIVDVGNAETAGALKEAFDLPFPLQKTTLATTIVPVYQVDAAGKFVGLGRTGRSFLAGRGSLFTPAAGLNAYVGIHNPSSDKVLHLSKIKAVINGSFVAQYVTLGKRAEASAARAGYHPVQSLDVGAPGELPVSAMFHYGDDAFAFPAYTSNGSRLHDVMYCVNSTVEREATPNIDLFPGYTFYIVSVNVALGFNFAYFEGEERDL